MEPAAVAAAAYGIETAIEGGVAAYYLSKPTLPLKGHLEHVTTTDTLPRSGHTLSVIGDRAYIFGGFGAWGREPINNDIHELHISTDENIGTAILRSIPAVRDGREKKIGTVPLARYDHSATVARNFIFIFGGSGFSPDEGKPLKEHGRLWIFDPLSSKWSFLDSPPNTPFPCNRTNQISTSSLDGSAVFIHGGLSSDGVCLNDLWVFYLEEGKWSKLPDAPGPPRNSSSLTCGRGKLWRFGGCEDSDDADSNPHGSIDFLEYPTGGTLDDVSESMVQGHTSNLKSTCQWETWDVDSSKTSEIPSPRSSAALHFITTGNGRDYLLLALEADDREVLSDIWIYQLPPAQYSSAQMKDVIREKLPGVESHRGDWSRLQISGIEVGADEEKGGAWTGRRRFGSSMTGTKQFMIWGGIGPGNETLGDGWRVIID
ncbi:hypothetical protein SBOR_7360 [Sclerotinia borealis F-4128]|uniref:Kelch domain-containing protein n=1 Tax=Sclerotinia borealis (strain F-4128) TaxID=1432307 RepID=W9CBK8_SCLBF|nr:hypothetical protein SBOR_7360 [Sclerotinia borealis F-4128]